MRTLSFDTSNPVLTVALMEDGKIVASRRMVPPESSRQEAVSQLMPTVDEITSKTGWDRKSIDLIIVGVGPGSFTGMRTSVVTARTLAQTMDIGLVGMDALRCYASVLKLPATIILSGGRGHYFVATYESAVSGKERWEFGDTNMKCSLEPCCLTGADFAAALEGVQRCYAEEKILDEVRAKFSSCEPIPEDMNMAEVQALLAHSDLELINKDRDKLKTMYAFDTVNPLYLRGASITMKATHADQPGTRN